MTQKTDRSWLKREEETLRVAAATVTSFANLSNVMSLAKFKVRTPGAYLIRLRNHQFDWHVTESLTEDIRVLDGVQKKARLREQAEREKIERAVRTGLSSRDSNPLSELMNGAGTKWGQQEEAYLHEAAKEYTDHQDLMAHMKAGGYAERSVAAYAAKLSTHRWVWPDIQKGLLLSLRAAVREQLKAAAAVAVETPKTVIPFHSYSPSVSPAPPIVAGESPVVRLDRTWLEGEEEALRVAASTATSFLALGELLQNAGFKVRTSGAYCIRIRNHSFDWYVNPALADDLRIMDSAQKKASKTRVAHRRRVEQEETKRAVLAGLVSPPPSVPTVLVPPSSVPTSSTAGRIETFEEKRARWDRERRAVVAMLPQAPPVVATRTVKPTEVTMPEEATPAQQLAFRMVAEEGMSPELAMEMVRRSVK